MHLVQTGVVVRESGMNNSKWLKLTEKRVCCVICVSSKKCILKIFHCVCGEHQKVFIQNIATLL